MGASRQQNPISDVERRKLVLQYYNEGKTQNEIRKIFRCGRRTVSADYEYLRQQGHRIRTSGEVDKGRWAGIIKAVSEQLPWFIQRGITPTLRAMFYRLYSLGLVPNTHNAYVSLSEETAIARRGYDWDYKYEEWKECTKYIKLDIHCFLDESRWTLGEYDDSEPEYPEPPEDPEEYINDAIQTLKDAPNEYDGEASEGSEPGRWNGQEYYVEVWLEKQTLGPTFESFLKYKDVKVVPNKGNTSVPFFYDNCMRLKQYQDDGKNVIILYFGDFDPSGDAMDEYIKRELELYGLAPEIFQRVAVTLEQVEQYDLPSDPDADTLFKLVGGTDPKTGKHKKGDPRTEAFMAKYGKLYATEVEAFLVYAPEAFEKIVQDSVDEYWDADVYDNHMREFEEKQDEAETIDPDQVRPMMYSKISEAFKPGWEEDV